MNISKTVADTAKFTIND